MVLSNPVSISCSLRRRTCSPSDRSSFASKTFLASVNSVSVFQESNLNVSRSPILHPEGFIRSLLPEVFSDWILKVDWFWLGDIVVSETDFSSDCSSSPKSVEILSISFSTPPRMALAAGISFSAGSVKETRIVSPSPWPVSYTHLRAHET